MTGRSVNKLIIVPGKRKDYIEIHEASRKKILRAAFELFGKKGYSATSVESIAKKAKVSKGLIYHYFKSKQDILKGIFTFIMEEGEMMMDWSERLPSQEFIQKMIDHSFDYMVNKTKFNRLLIAISVQPEVVKGLKKEIDKAKDVWMNKLIGILRELNFEHPEEEAYLLGAVLDGVGLGYLAMGPDYPIEKIRKRVKKRYDIRRQANSK